MYSKFCKAAIAAAVFAGSTSYAATNKNIGSISDRVGLNEAVVDLGSDQVKVGDKVTVYEQVCNDRRIGKDIEKYCSDHLISQGEVINAGRRTSVIRLQNADNIKAGDTVKIQ